MSAYLVHKAHIDALVTAGLALPRFGPLAWAWPHIGPGEEPDAGLHDGRHRELTEATAGRVGTMLWTENQRSVGHLYDRGEGWTPDYEFQRLPGNLLDQRALATVLKAIDCYEYRSSEHLQWRQSEAKPFRDALRGAAVERLPGYDDAAAWDITDRGVFAKVTQARVGDR